METIVPAVIGLITTYGPEAVTLIEGLVKTWQSNGQTLTVAQVEAAIANLPSYDQFGIPKAFTPPA
jgi:hypothetical protein